MVCSRKFLSSTSGISLTLPVANLAQIQKLDGQGYRRSSDASAKLMVPLFSSFGRLAITSDSQDNP